MVPPPPDGLDVGDLRELCDGARSDLETAEEYLDSVPVPKEKKSLWNLSHDRIRDLFRVERVMADVLYDTASNQSLNAYYWVIKTLDSKARFRKILIHEYTRRSSRGVDDLIRYKAFLRQLALNHWEVLDSVTTSKEPHLDTVRDQVGQMEPILKNLAWLTAIFVCYAREDEKTLNLLADIIQAPLRAKHVFLWWDRKPPNDYDTDDLVAGGIITTAKWEYEIERRLELFDFAMGLTSRSFDGSLFIGGKELPAVLKDRAERGIRFMPVRLEECKSEELLEISQTQWFPTDKADRVMNHLTNSGFDSDFRQLCAGRLVDDIETVMKDLANRKKVEAFIRAWQSSPPAGPIRAAAREPA
jgi:hypothetical protein